VLEANYDEQMLDNGRYPQHLKNRIRGGHGHISNKQALELFVRRRHPHLSHLLLAHLSADNNNPELAHNMFAAVAGKTKIVVASRYAESAVYHITGPAIAPPPKIKPAKPRVVQATLF
jgi:phosphoribosyl 1,2-cyclic phosphodiesterase